MTLPVPCPSTPAGRHRFRGEYCADAAGSRPQGRYVCRAVSLAPLLLVRSLAALRDDLAQGLRGLGWACVDPQPICQARLNPPHSRALICVPQARRRLWPRRRGARPGHQQPAQPGRDGCPQGRGGGQEERGGTRRCSRGVPCEKGPRRGALASTRRCPVAARGHLPACLAVSSKHPRRLELQVVSLAYSKGEEASSPGAGYPVVLAGCTAQFLEPWRPTPCRARSHAAFSRPQARCWRLSA